jgi:hypothetical protein
MSHFEIIDLNFLNLKLINIADRTLRRAIAKNSETYLLRQFGIIAALSENRFGCADLAADHHENRSGKNGKCQKA